MSIKNFKIEQGLDLDGLILTNGTGELLVNGNVIATELYVANAISGVTIDPSGWAGNGLDWTGDAFVVDAGVVATLSGAQTLVNKTLATSTLVGSGNNSEVQFWGTNILFLNKTFTEQLGTTTDITISNTTDGFFDGSFTVYEIGSDSGGTIIFLDQHWPGTDSFDGTIILKLFKTVEVSPTETAYLDGVTSNIQTQLNDRALANSIPAAYTDADARNAINSVLSSTSGLAVGSNDDLQVDTTVIATKAYVDATAQGLDIKASVKSATVDGESLNLSSLSMSDTIGGITLSSLVASNPTRVLLKNQGNTAQNGIYDINYNMGTYDISRAEDATFDSNESTGGGTLSKGSFVFVESGTNSGKGYVANIYYRMPDYGVSWTQFSEAGSYITSVGPNLSVDAGALTLTSNVVTIDGEQTLSNKTFSDSISLSGMGNFTISGASNIIIAPDAGHSAYIGSVSSENEIVTMGNVPAGYTNTNAVNAIANVLISGGGIEYVANTGFQIDTDTVVTVNGEQTLTNKTILGSTTIYDAGGSGFHSITPTSEGILQIVGGQGIDLSAINGAVKYNGSEVATKPYVDAIAQGLDIKASVSYATTSETDITDPTGSISLANTLDGTVPLGAVLAPNARVLFKDLQDPSLNGIYVWDDVNYTFTLADDANTFEYRDASSGTSILYEGKVSEGTFTFVERGVNAGKGFVVSTLQASVTGVNAMIWTQFSEAGSFITSVDGATALNVNSGILSINTGSGLTTGNTLAVDYATVANTLVGTGLVSNNGQLELADDITVESVSITNPVTSVTADLDVFGHSGVTVYSPSTVNKIVEFMGDTKVVDVFVTITSITGTTRTSKLTGVFTGGEAPTWTEYGIVDSIGSSGVALNAEITFTQAITVNPPCMSINVAGMPTETYSVHGVVTSLR